MDEHPGELTDTLALARRLKLSRWAVSRALNGQPGVSADTRARVEAAVAEAGFEPNAHARGLRGAGPGTVGLAVPSLRDPAWMTLAGGLGEGLIIRGLQPDWTVGTGEPAGDVRAWTRYAARRVRAVLVIGAGAVPAADPGSAAPWGQLCRRGVPVIFVEPAWSVEPDGLTIVRSDHRAAAALVAGYLHAAGHRQLDLRGFGARDEPRASLLRAACEARGLSCRTLEPDAAPSRLAPSPPSRVAPRGKTTTAPGGTSPVGSGQGARRGRPPAAATATALVTGDDLTALRSLCELRAAGRRVPGDCSVVGYGDDPAGAFSAPALTTVDPQRAQLVARTLELLDELLRDPGGVRAGCLWIAPLLRCRGSVGNVSPT